MTLRAGSPAAFGLVALGGGVGGLLRYVATQVVTEPAVGFPTTTFVVNVLGCLALGFCVGGPFTVGPAWLRPTLGTGLIGGFTTFSAVVHAARATASGGLAGTAVGYLAASVLVGVLAAAIGMGLGARWAVRRAEDDADAHPDRLPGAPEEWART